MKSIHCILGLLLLSLSSVLMAANPNREFSVDKTEGYGPLVVTFDASNIKPAKKYYWNLGNGETLTTTSSIVTYAYKRAGAFSASLKFAVNASNKELDNLKDAGSVNINVINTPPSVNLFASKLTGVIPLAIDFQARNLVDSDGDIASVVWNFSDGQTANGINVSHTFSTVGSFNVILKVTDNLGAVTTKSVKITTLEPLREVPIIAFKYFEDGSTVIDLRSSPVKTQFDLERVFYTIDGSQIVPVADFYPGTRTLVDLKNYGTHSITLTVVDIRGQTASETYSVSLLEDPSTLKPVVDFRTTPSSVRTVFFNLNRSFNPDSLFGIKNYHLEFGDGTSADITDDTFATHTYPTSGTYTATLNVTTGQGTKAAASKTFTVSNLDVPIINPVASFSYQINSWAQNVSFYNEKSGTPNGEIISYLWDFGDGSSGTGDRVAHFYEPGSYLVTLTVTDSAGLRNSQTQNVIIYQEGSDLVTNIDCGESTTQTQVCTITALDKFNEINSVRVLWGDGTSSTLSTPVVPEQGIYKATKKFLTNGVQTISVYVSTTRGEAKTATITKEVLLPSPIAKINCTTAGLKLNCNSAGTIDSSGAGIASFVFDYGDGTSSSPSTEGFTNYTYSAPGIYTVSLTVRSNSGLSNTISTSAGLNYYPPVASITCSTSNLLVNCNALGSFDSQGFPLTFEFDYGDSFIEFSANGLSTHTYSESGLYNVKVKVTSLSGLSTFASTQVQPLKAPNILPMAKIACVSTMPLQVECNAIGSIDTDGQIISYKYEFADNASTIIGSSTSVEHLFVESGMTTINLTVIDNEGGLDQESVNVFIRDYPAFEIEALPSFGDIPLPVQFNLVNLDPSFGNILFVRWEFGDNQVSDERSPVHTYEAIGIFQVKVKVTFENNLSINQFVQVSTTTHSKIIITADTETGEAPLPVHFDGRESTDPISSIVKYEWYYLNKKIGDESSVDVLLQNKGDNVIILKVTNQEGITTTGSKIISVSEPSIYIENTFPKAIIANEEYLGEVLITHVESIPSENIRISFENLPDGFQFDQVTRKFSWNPGVDQRGVVKFKVIASDGLIFTERVVEINVNTKIVLANLNVPVGGGQYTVSDPGTVIDKMIIKLPPKTTSYSVEVVKYDLISGVGFGVESQNDLIYEYELNSPALISFPFQERKFEAINLANNNPDLGPFEIEKGRACSSDQLGISKIVSSLSSLYVTPYFGYNIYKSISGVNFYTNGSKAANNAVDYLFSDNDFYSKLPNHIYNLYFVVSEGANGETPSNSLDTSIIYIVPEAEISEYEKIRVKKTVFHEDYHIRQHEITNCNIPENAERGDWYALDEGSAEHKALSKLDFDDRVVMLKSYYEFSQKDPFRLSSFASKNGILSYDGIPKKVSYETRLIWDFFPDIDLFYTYLYNKHGKGLHGFQNLNKELVAYSKENDIAIGGQLSQMLASYYDNIADINFSRTTSLHHISTPNTSTAIPSPLKHAFKSSSFSNVWSSGYQNLYSLVIADGDMSVFNFSDSIPVVFDKKLSPLSSERQIISLPSDIKGFNTLNYPIYLKVQSNEGKLIYKTQYEYLFAEIEYGTGLKRHPDSSSAFWGRWLDSSELPSKHNINWPHNIFSIDLINPTSEELNSKVEVKSACHIFSNISFQNAYYDGGVNPDGSRHVTRKEDNFINVSCGNSKECFVEVKLCKSNFDFKTKDAWNDFATAFTDCPVTYAIPHSGSSETGYEFRKISATGSKLTGFSNSTNIPELFGAEGGEVWSDGKLVVCQIGGEYSESISAE